MPRIPDYNVPSVQIQPVSYPEFQGPGVAPMPNAAPQQIQELGQGMSRFGQGMSEMAMRMQDMVNDSVVAETDNKWRDFLNQESVKFQTLQGRDAITGYNSFQENLAKQRKEIETGLTNPAQKAAFRNAANQRMMEVDKQANFHVMREAYNFKVAETDSRIKNMEQDAVEYGAKIYDPGTPLSIKMLDGTGAISNPTAAAITAGARAQNIDSFQIRVNSLVNQAKEHLSFQGINPDDEQGKLYIKTMERNVHSGVLQRMLHGNDTNSARMFLADKNYRSKVDPELVYKAENSFAKARKNEVGDNIARAIFLRDDLPTVGDKQSFARAAFVAGQIDQDDLTKILGTIESLSKDEQEARQKSQLQALDLAKTKFRAATQGLGFSKNESAGNALLRLDQNLYMQLGEEGLTKFETWVREGYQEKTNPGHRSALIKLMANKPELFKELTESQLALDYQLSSDDREFFAARIAEANKSATPAQRQILSDKELLIGQFRKERSSAAALDNDQILKSQDFFAWQENVSTGWNQFLKDNPKGTLQEFLSKRNTNVIVDNKSVNLYTLEPGTIGAFRVQVPNTNISVDVLPGDIPDDERAKVITAINNSNANLFRVYKRETDENGAMRLVLHRRSDNTAAMHGTVTAALAEAKQLGEGYEVQKGDVIPSDEQTIATQWVRDVQARKEDVPEYVTRVRRRADFAGRIKAQGQTSFDEYMQKFIDNPGMPVHVPTLVEQLSIADEVARLPEGVASPYMREYNTIWVMQGKNVKADPSSVNSYILRTTDPTRGIPQKRTPEDMAKAKKFGEKLLSEGIPSDNESLLEQFGLAQYRRPVKALFEENFRKDFESRYQTVTGAQAFGILEEVAKGMGMEVSPELKQAMSERLKQFEIETYNKKNPQLNMPAKTADQQARAQLNLVTSEQRKAMAQELRAATWQKGSYEWHLSNTPQDQLRNFFGPFAESKSYSPNSTVKNRVPPSPLGVSLLSDLQRAATAFKLNESFMPTEGGSADALAELERMMELVYQGDYTEAEKWRIKNDTIQKAYKAVLPNKFPK